jgi:endonuclease/exonuclease/phosphatase family metal-dependent hydrolase
VEPDWRNRRHEIVSWLDHLRADVVCLQEIWEASGKKNTAHWIADESATDWHVAVGVRPFGAAVLDDPGLLFGSAILSRWPIDTQHYEPLGLDPQHSDPFLAAIPWELLHVSTAGLDIGTVHLAPAPTQSLHHHQQVLQIDRYFRAVRGHADDIPSSGTFREKMPAILCGDFNAEPDSDEIRFLCSLAPLDGQTTFWQDAWRMAGEGPGYTQDWRTNPIADAANIGRKRIDYVFIGDAYQRRAAGGRVLSAEVVFHEPRTGVIASDHFGVVVEIVWPDRPPNS